MLVNKYTIWGKIPGYPNYIVSIDGDIISKARITDLGAYGKRRETTKVLSQFNKRKYRAVALGKGRQEMVHRLVAMSFFTKPKYKGMVLHKDDVGSNNTYENLYWGDGADNADDAIRNGYKPTFSYKAIENSAKVRRTKVICYNEHEELLFNSKTDAARYFDIVNSSISNALKNGTTIGLVVNGLRGTHRVRLA